jgi:hypothetical protein
MSRLFCEGAVCQPVRTVRRVVRGMRKVVVVVGRATTLAAGLASSRVRAGIRGAILNVS